MKFEILNLPTLKRNHSINTRYPESNDCYIRELDIQKKLNQEKYDKIIKNEMEILNRKNIIIQNKVKEIDENVKKIKSLNKLTIPKIIKTDNNSLTASVSQIKNSSIKYPASLDDKQDMSPRIDLRKKFARKIKQKMENDLTKSTERNFSHIPKIECINENSLQMNNNLSLIGSASIKSIQNKKIEGESKTINHINFNSYCEYNEEEDQDKVNALVRSKEKKLDEILWKIGKRDANFKKIQQLKNYDVMVYNLLHIREIFSKKEKPNEQSFISNSLLNNSHLINQFTGRNEEMMENNISKRKNMSVDILKMSNNYKNNKISLSKNSQINTTIHNLSNINNLEEETYRPKLVDKYKAKLNCLYKFDNKKLEQINKVKQMKNLPLEEYQKKLMDVASELISDESISDLLVKFKSIKEQNKLDEKDEKFDIKNKLNELKYQVEQAEMYNFRNLKDNKVKIEKIILKKNYTKKRKLDENLKRIGQYLPAELFEKLQAI